MMSRISSGLPIFAMSRHEHTLNLTALYRGVTPVYFDSHKDGVIAANEAVNRLRDKGFRSPAICDRHPWRRDGNRRHHQYQPYPARRIIHAADEMPAGSRWPAFLVHRA